MELRQLQYFQMVSRFKNITRAAERLKVSQPNITVAIKKLESELGILLFDRSQKQLSLTPEGKVFLSRIEVALRNIKDAVLEVNDYRDLKKGTIKIGIPPMIGCSLFPQIFSSFRKIHPQLDIYLYEEGSMAIRESLESDNLDFGIVILHETTKLLQALPMMKCRPVACVNKNHPYASRDKLTLQDFNGADMILLKDGSFLRYFLLQQCAAAGFAPNIILESNQVETIKGLISTNDGIGFLLDFNLENSPDIKLLPVEGFPEFDIGLAWKSNRYISNASQSFIDYCKENLVK